MADCGFTLIEVATSLIIIVVLALMLVPLANGLLDTQRASKTEDDLNKIYTAIVGDPKQNTYGYLGDVGAFPSSLMGLVQSDGSNGWNGPYLTGATIDTSTGTSQIYDSFGSPMEYYAFSPTATANLADQLSLVSRGPDRSSSTNSATNPNVNLGAPPNSNTSANADNVPVPHIFDNYNLSYYQSLGKLNINIMNSDDNASFNGVVPGCANYFDVTITSIPRGTVEAWVNYAPGGASFDLVQGLYRYTIYVAGSTTPVWQEQVAIVPDNTISRTVTLPGVNSSLTSTLSLSAVNNIAAGHTLTFYQGSTKLNGTALAYTATYPATPTVVGSPNRCARVYVVDSTPNTIIDSFIMPNPQSVGNTLGSAGITRTYTSSTCSFTVTNSSGTHSTIAVYDNGILIGTVGKRGKLRSKTFTVKAIGGTPDTVTFKDETNMSQGSSPACGGTTTF